MKKKIEETLSIIIVFVLMYAGLIKLITHNTTFFEWSISEKLRPYALLLSIILPVMEILIAIGLFVHKTRFYGSVLATVLFVSYIVAMYQLKLYLPNIRGGIFNQLSFNQFLILNSVLLVMSVSILAILIGRKKIKVIQTREVIYT